MNNPRWTHRIPWYKFGTITLSLPLLGLAFCVYYSIRYDFEKANKTHCNVWNYLPSISATTGSKPQSTVWKACISLHTLPRYFICICYMDLFYNSLIARQRDLLGPIVSVMCVCNFIEVTALLMLTLVSSSDNFEIHKMSFVIFILMSIVYMGMNIAIASSIATHSKIKQMKRSIWFKKWTMVVNISVLILAGYFYYRHNTYCEPGVYSLFGLSEYLFVLSNIAYHATAILDFSAPPVKPSQDVWLEV